MNPRHLAFLVSCLVATVVLATRAAGAADGKSTFDERVAPILLNRCFECHHGPKPKGGLDLSRRETVLTGGESGPAIIPGKPEESPIWQRISAGEMPPKKPLSSAEQAVIKEWITHGAHWGKQPLDPFRTTSSTRAGYDWWSLQPVSRPKPPTVRQTTTLRGPIDSFIVQKLEQAGLSPAPTADRRTYIRRVTFDLTGLPPSPEEVTDFERDTHPLAFERLVDRLLASPQYGERWARHWLDLARFGESNGFEYDEPRRNAWPYRDWVIRALNDDLAFDEFARQQVAGDALYPDNPAALTATGFLTAGPYDTAGQNQQSAAMKAVVRQDELEDLVSTVSQTFLGLTVHCARCHDHKFDPIRQTDYYRLTSALGGVRQGEREVMTAAERQEQRRLAALRQQQITALAARIAEIERPARKQICHEAASHSKVREGTGEGPSERLLPQPTASWEFDGNARDSLGPLDGQMKGRATIDGGRLVLDGVRSYVATAPLRKDLAAKTLEVCVSLKTLRQAGGAAISVQTLDGAVFDAVVFGEQQAGCWMAGSDNYRRTRSFAGSPEIEAEHKPVVITVTYAADGMITGYRNGRPYGRAYRTAKPFVFRAGRAQVLFGLRHGDAGGNRLLKGAIERAAIYDRALAPDEVAASARRPIDFASDAQIAAKLAPQARREREGLLARLSGLQAALDVPIQRMTHAVAPRQPEPTRLLIRGDIRQASDVLSAGGVASLIGIKADFGLLPDAPEARRRIALARWLTNPQNPLFGRVIVNRLWLHHFGAGLVDTPNDFGFNGGRPTHPQLLDWLAVRLSDRKWSLKQLHREIVLSATYRQAFADNPAATKQDSDNRWLWTRTPQRLDAEAMRDAILVAAGELRRTVGGPGFRDFKEVFRSGTYTYEPADVFDSSFNRRTIYRTWNRGGRSGLLDAFDCPDPSVITPKRAVTTTPLQALALLNDAFTLKMAARIADRGERDVRGDLDRQIEHVYRWSLARDPDSVERRAARQIVGKHGLAALARVLFNSNEFLYVD
jgi:cytochrome c553